MQPAGVTIGRIFLARKCGMLMFEKQREQALLTYLDSLVRRDAVLGYYQIQGLLYAMACSPEPVRPAEWFELIWLSDAPQFDDVGDARSFWQLLVELARHIEAEARAARYRPGLDAGGNVSDVALADWCDGFLLGHQYLEEIWGVALDDLNDDELYERVDETLDQAAAFAAGELTDDPSAEETLLAAYLQFQELLVAYHAVHDAWGRVERTLDMQAMYEQLEPVGRDEWCPCGSGRRFGQCCLH
jgi:uncharacterized protein